MPVSNIELYYSYCRQYCDFPDDTLTFNDVCKLVNWYYDTSKEIYCTIVNLEKANYKLYRDICLLNTRILRINVVHNNTTNFIMKNANILTNTLNFYIDEYHKNKQKINEKNVEFDLVTYLIHKYETIMNRMELECNVF